MDKRHNRDCRRRHEWRPAERPTRRRHRDTGSFRRRRWSLILAVLAVTRGQPELPDSRPQSEHRATCEPCRPLELPDPAASRPHLLSTAAATQRATRPRSLPALPLRGTSDTPRTDLPRERPVRGEAVLLSRRNRHSRTPAVALMRGRRSSSHGSPRSQRSACRGTTFEHDDRGRSEREDAENGRGAGERRDHAQRVTALVPENEWEPPVSSTPVSWRDHPAPDDTAGYWTPSCSSGRRIDGLARRLEDALAAATRTRPRWSGRSASDYR